MKTKLLFSAVAMLAGSLLADPTPGDVITNAVNALAGQPNYSWKSTVVVPDDSPFKPGPTTGKLEKDGYTDVSTSMRDNTIEFISKGDVAAVNTPDNGWQSLADATSDQQGPGRFLAGMIRNFKAPTVQALALAGGAAALTQDGGVISGDLTEAGAKAQLAFGGRRGGGGGGGGGPEISGAKGSVKFWITDGTLTKYEFKVAGKVSFNGNDRDIDRDTTVEFTDVGTTKVTVPADAQKVLAPTPAAAAAPAAN
jgi:hypothetical protein